MANNQNQKNRDDQTTNNQSNNQANSGQSATQGQNDKRTAPQTGKESMNTGNVDKGQERKDAPGRQDGSSNTR